MATEVLAVNGVGAEDSFTNEGGANKPASVALPNDEDTTRITGQFPPLTQRLTFANPTVIDADDTITNVTITVRAKDVGAGIATFTISQHDGTNESTSGALNTGAGYADFTYSLNSPPSGGSWTLAQLQNLSTLISLTAGVPVLAVTTVFATVTYTAVSSPVTDLTGQQARNDDGSEITATWIDNLDADISFNPFDGNLRIRSIIEVTVANLTTFDINTLYDIDKGSGYEGIANLGTNGIDFGPSANFVHEAPTTQQISSGGFDAGVMIDESDTPTISIDQDNKSEIEVSLAFDTDVVENGWKYRIYLYNNGVELDSYTVITITLAIPQTCDDPTGVSAKYDGVHSGGINHRLTWTPFNGDLEIQYLNNSLWTNVATVDGNTGEYLHTQAVIAGLDKAYYYRFRQDCGSIQSNWVYILSTEHTYLDRSTHRHGRR